MNHERTWSAAFLGYCDDALELLELRLTGRETSVEAERLRDQMTQRWDDLSAEEEERAGWMLADLNWIVRSGPPPRRPTNLPSQVEVVAAMIEAFEADDVTEIGRRYRQFGIDDAQEYLMFIGNWWMALGVVSIGVKLLRAAAAIRENAEVSRDLLQALASTSDPTLAATALNMLNTSNYKTHWWYAAFELNNAASLNQIAIPAMLEALESRQQASAGVRLMLGLSLHERGQYERALTSIRHALRDLKEPDEPALALLMSMGHTILAREDITQRKPQNALKSILKARESLPHRWPVPIEIQFEQIKLQIIAIAQLGEVAKAQRVLVEAMTLLLEVNAPEEYQALFAINTQLAASARDHSVADIKLPDPIPLPARLPLRPSLHLPTLAA